MTASETSPAERAWPVRLGRFLAVGGSGTLVNLAVVAFLTRVFGFHVTPAGVPAFAVAVTWNYALNRLWTFRARRVAVAGSYVRYVVGALAGLATQLAVTHLLHESAGLLDLAAAAAGIAAGALLNYSASEWWAFRRARAE